MGVRRAIAPRASCWLTAKARLRIMTPLFKLGPGVPIGSGNGLVAASQWMSWIHLDNVVGVFQLAVENEAASGPINGTSPHPVTNAEFARAPFRRYSVNHTLRWRVYLPFGPPDAMLKLILGEVAGVITTGQRVRPAKALALGYSFKYPTFPKRCERSSQPSPPRRRRRNHMPSLKLGHPIRFRKT